MGNHNFTPRRQYQPKQPVAILGCEFSRENVPEELKKFGPGAYVMKSGVMYQSRPNAPKVYVTRVKFPTGKDELFLTNDLYTLEEAKKITQTPIAKSPRSTGSRVVNSRYNVH